MTRITRTPLTSLVALLLPLAPVAAQQHAAQSSTPTRAQGDVQAQLAADRALLAAETYQLPPAEIVRLATAPRFQNVSLTQPSPTRKYFLKEESEGLPSVQSFGKPHYYFGGLQVDFKANRARALTTRGASGLELIDPLTGKTRDIETPAGATVSSPAWSPDGNQLAYIANFDAASYVYVADVATGKSQKVTTAPLLATLVTTIDWTADGKNIITVLVPEPRKPEPVRPAIATGPEVRLWTDGVKAPERNFASLLQEPFDMALLEYYVTGQLAVVDVKSHAVKKIGQPAMISAVDASPDAQYFRVTSMEKPFSYVVQYNSFGTVEELWDAAGKVVAEIQKRPLRIGAPDTASGGGRGGPPETKRGLAWMPQGTGMYYLEAAPGRRGSDSADAGNGNGRGGRGGRGGAAGGTRPDRLIKWNAPFGAGDTTVLYTGTGPISDAVFTNDGKTVFVAGTSAGQGQIVAVDLAAPGIAQVVIRQRNYTPTILGGGRAGRGGGGGGRGGADDSLAFYSNPGALVTTRGTLGGRVAMVSSDGAVFLQGTQYDRDWQHHAPREFVDKIDVKTGTKARVFEAAEDAAETIGAPLDDNFSKAIVTRESPTQTADSYLRDMKTGQMTKLTNNKDYAPDFTAFLRKRIWVTRADGFKFLVRLTLPADYKAGTRLPGMFWFYPYEYTDQNGYDRTLRTENINRFPQAGPRTIEYLVTQGYAVANFDPPIVGETGRMNDNYVSDLVMNLSAVIDELDKQGFIDRSRLGIGGHSYGAFSTMNALVHTPFFKAGIAGDGMYNRTLTPTGFQNERRDFWSGQKTYEEMSPFFYADKLQGAILMYHSMEDQNVGTDPISSIRMMQALRAYGKTAALYMYPYEDHGPATRESDLDQWARWVAWLDVYVKHAGENGTGKAATAAESSNNN